MATDLTTPLSSEFCRPNNKEVGASRKPADGTCTYLCGNSLGLLSQRSKTLIAEELEVWSTRAVIGHFNHPHRREWTKYVDHVNPLCAEIVGAKPIEVACMGTLTANLHLLMDSFYKPTKDRWKILCEANAFPSDRYALASQAKLHGYDPKDAVLEMSPREGEYCLREQDILDTIEKEGATIALVLFSGIQYYTGQWFPMEKITKKAKEKGCICGWDLAHAVGNVPLALHDWDVDFAVWCTYKYLNAGPGSIGGLFIHEKWHDIEKPKYAGWWGHNPQTRFEMTVPFTAIPGAQGFQQSNPCALSLSSLLGALRIHTEVGMPKIRERSLALTARFQELLVQSKYFVPLDKVSEKYQGGYDKPGFTIITPNEPESRGAQLSLLFLPEGSGIMLKVFHILVELGVIGDERKPSVIRLSPCPLYNTLTDCQQAAIELDRAFEELEKM